MQSIAYHYEHKYGNKLCYVSDPEQAKALRLLTGRATLLQSDRDALASLGFSLVHIPKN